MRNKIINKFFMLTLLFSGYLCASTSMHAQQLDNHSDESLDLNFRSVDPLTFNGSSYTIDGESLRNMPVTHLANLLSGLIPGFYSRQTSGSIINEAPSYWIRGRRTPSEGVLVLVDGQERSFGSLSSYEIDKITVLKDAAAVVLYGMRAANGAILVTTRRGEIGKPKIEFSAQLVTQQPLRMPKPLNAYNYTRLYNEAYLNDNPLASAGPYSDPNLFTNSNTPEIYPDKNWLGDYYDVNQLMQRYNLNVSGGTKRSRYFVNFGALVHEGMYNTDKAHSYSTNNEINRYNIRSNFEVDITSTTLLTADIYGWAETQNRPNGSSIDAFTAMVQTPANAFPPYFFDHGHYKDLLGQPVIEASDQIIAGSNKYSNPWALINRGGYNTGNEIYGSFRVKLEQDLAFMLPGLKASGDISMDSQVSWVINRKKGYAYYEYKNPFKNDSTLRKTGTDGTMNNGVEGKSSNRRTSLNLQLTYSKQFGEHNVSALAGYNQYESADEVSIPTRMQSVNAWLGYNYDKRYGIDLLASYSGSYKFAKGKRFGFFPSIAAGWTISNEAFFKDATDIFTHLRLRGSIGIVGDQRGIPAHQFMSSLEQKGGVYNFGNNMGGAGGYIMGQIANEDVTWEKALIYNIGIEGRMFNNQLSFMAEYFKDQRSDIYRDNQRIGGMYGLVLKDANNKDKNFQQNIGSMYSQGIDVSIQWSSKIGDVRYNIGANYSLSKNMIQDFGEADKEYEWLYAKGYPYGVLRGLTFAGFFQDQAEIDDPTTPLHTYSPVYPGDLRYVDINDDGVIDDSDVKPFKYGTVPDQFFGINLGAEYKGLGFTLLFQGAANVARNISSDGYFALPFYSNGNIYEHQLNYWSPATASTAEYPRLSVNNSSSMNNIINSNFWFRDADYIRLKTAQIYYNLPEKLFGQKSLLQGVQFYLSGYNLLTWDKLKIMDPEWDPTTFPVTRNISVGCTIKI